MAAGTETFTVDLPGLAISTLIVGTMLAPFFLKLWRNHTPEKVAKSESLPLAPPQEWWQKVVNNDPGHAPAELPAVAAKPAPGYHLTAIERGELGELSKVREELFELYDAQLQKSRIMVSVELADMVGAFQAFLDRHMPGNDVGHLARISDSSAFAENEPVSVINIANAFGHLERMTVSKLPEAQLAAAVGFMAVVQAFTQEQLGLTVKDLVIFANITKRAFENGHRSAKTGAA